MADEGNAERLRAGPGKAAGRPRKRGARATVTGRKVGEPAGSGRSIGRGRSEAGALRNGCASFGPLFRSVAYR